MNENRDQPVLFTPIPTFFIDPVPRIFLCVMLLLAFLFGASDLAGFCLVVLLLSTGAKLWRRAAAPGVTCRFRSDKLRAFPDESLSFCVDVANGSILPVKVRSLLAGAGAFEGPGQGENLRVCKVGPRQTVSMDWAWKASRRGVYRIGPPVTEAGDALGFFFVQKDRQDPLEIVVYPRLFPIAPFGGQPSELFGSLRAQGLIGDPVNLVGTREYQPGSPARSIHWKASARLNRLQEKVFEPSRRARFLLSLDVRGFHEAGDGTGFEETLETAASIARHLIGEGASVGAITNARIQGERFPVIPVNRRPGHLPSILEMLARMTMEPADGRTALLQRVLLHRNRGVACILFSHTAEKAAEALEEIITDGTPPVSILVARQSRGAASQLAGATEILPIDLVRRGGDEAA